MRWGWGVWGVWGGGGVGGVGGGGVGGAAAEREELGPARFSYFPERRAPNSLRHRATSCQLCLLPFAEDSQGTMSSNDYE